MHARILWIAEQTPPLDLRLGSASVRVVSTPAAATAALEQEVFTAIVYQPSSALQASYVQELRAALPELPILIFEPGISIEQAVLYTKWGMTSCASSTAALQSALSPLLAAVPSQTPLRPTSKKTSSEEPWRRFLIGESYAIQKVVEMIRLVAARRSTVLITGETGTGKEVVARALHLESNRSQNPMVSVNCSAIPSTLMEAELFGHTKGAFTGATATRVGRFEQANKSTLFLDEVAEMPIELQAKLLRVLQERELQRVGSSETIKVDVRIIAAANVDLAQQVADRKFREDLFYRLNVVPIRLPAVRERKSDIPLLLQHFLEKICHDEGIPVKRLTGDALKFLCAYDWPGNVRQIEHAVEMAVAMSGDRDVLRTEDFGLPATANPPETAVTAPKSSSVVLPEDGLDFEQIVGRLEASLLFQALSKANGNKCRAAELLGLKRTTFLAKLKNCASLLPEVESEEIASQTSAAQCAVR